MKGISGETILVIGREPSVLSAPAAEGVRRSDLGAAAAPAAAPALDVPALAADAKGRFGRGPAKAVERLPLTGSGTISNRS